MRKEIHALTYKGKYIVFAFIITEVNLKLNSDGDNSVLPTTCQLC